MTKKHNGQNAPAQFNFELEYSLIRTKKISYLGKPAYAIYFQNMTKHVNEIRLES